MLYGGCDLHPTRWRCRLACCASLPDAVGQPDRFPAAYLSITVRISWKTMVAKLIRWAVNNVIAVMLAVSALIAVGTVSFLDVNVEAYPDPAPAIIEVVAQYPALGGGSRATGDDPDRGRARRHAGTQIHRTNRCSASPTCETNSNMASTTRGHGKR